MPIWYLLGFLVKLRSPNLFVVNKLLAANILIFVCKPYKLTQTLVQAQALIAWDFSFESLSAGKARRCTS